jgi:hypothetical protein
MELLKSIFLVFIWILSCTLVVYLVFLHIQFAVIWIRKHRSTEGLRYTAFMKSKLMRRHVWGVLIVISVGLAILFAVTIFLTCGMIGLMKTPD